MSRRGVLGLAGIGVGAFVLAACAPAASSSNGTSGSTAPSASPSASPTAGSTATTTAAGEIPDETAGPYPGDGSNGPDVLADSGIVRQDIRSSIDGSATADGVPLTFELQIFDTANGDIPFAGVAVYAWHCTADGEYSMYSSGLENVTYLRGVQVADADGKVSFSSIFPGCYTGRWPHIHFEVYPDAASITDSANAIATSQIALPEEACTAVYADSRYSGSAQSMSSITLDSDNVFGDDAGALQLATISGNTSSGYNAALQVRVDTATAPTAGSAPGGGPGEPPAN